MAGFFDLFRRGNLNESTTREKIVEDTVKIRENSNNTKIREVTITEDNKGNDLLGDIQSITESSDVSISPTNLTNLIDGESDAFRTSQILTGLRSISANSDEIFMENEEMSRDAIVGAAMEIIADDSCQVDERRGKAVVIESDDEKLARFLNDFLENTVDVEDRIWTWAFEIVKHGDLKLRRREYYVGSVNSGYKNVYYEDVLNPYKVIRIEYMGKVLGYEDFDLEDTENTAAFQRPEEFVHFISSKLSRKEKVKVRVKDPESGELEDVTCYKVLGTSLVDNVRYIYRIINMLDNMLILSRLARSTQYNLVKVEVGNASPGKTQQILSNVRRTLEGNTRMTKNSGMKTDPSPIPINSNVYLPTREGKGDVTVDPVGDNVDVRSIVDIDYFRDKEFAALKIPKSYMGFEEAIGGSLGNNSLVKMDIRYARSVQRAQNILKIGIRNLCNNYLQYRGNLEGVNKFTVSMRPLVTSETSGRIEEFMTNMQALDATNGMLQSYGAYIDNAKLFKTMLNFLSISPSEVGSKEFLTILKEMEDGTYDESNHKVATSDEGGSDW